MRGRVRNAQLIKLIFSSNINHSGIWGLQHQVRYRFGRMCGGLIPRGAAIWSPLARRRFVRRRHFLVIFLHFRLCITYMPKFGPFLSALTLSQSYNDPDSKLTLCVDCHLLFRPCDQLAYLSTIEPTIEPTISLSLSLSLFVPLTLCLSHSLSLSLFASLFLSLSLSVYELCNSVGSCAAGVSASAKKSWLRPCVGVRTW